MDSYDAGTPRALQGAQTHLGNCTKCAWPLKERVLFVSRETYCEWCEGAGAPIIFTAGFLELGDRTRKNLRDFRNLKIPKSVAEQARERGEQVKMQRIKLNYDSLEEIDMNGIIPVNPMSDPEDAAMEQHSSCRCDFFSGPVCDACRGGLR